MADVFVLHHVHELGEDEDAKLIGVYSTREQAQSAISRLADQSGFREHPDGFHIGQYTLDEDDWTEGFVTVVPILVAVVGSPDEWRTVHAESLPNEEYRIITPNDSPDREQWAYNAGDVVRCTERQMKDGSSGFVAVEVA